MPTRRFRLAAAAVVLIAAGALSPVAAAADATPAQPLAAGTGVPGAPTVTSAVAGFEKVTLTIAPPSDAGGSPITAYVVTPYVGKIALTPQTFTDIYEPLIVWKGLATGVSFRFVVQAVNGSGTGAASVPSTAATPSGPPTLVYPFQRWDYFVVIQLLDFTSGPGTNESRAAAVSALAEGTITPSAYIAGLIGNPWYRPNLAPAARLYWAYFGRIPDHGGLEYWTKKRRAGTTLIKISASFAASSEFKRTYGSLSDAAFVDLVYQNVLGRPGDAGGRSYWLGKLAKGASRGQVMVNFSESGEYVRKLAAPVGLVEVFFGMLERSPTPAELALLQDEPIRTVIDGIRLTLEYRIHVG